MHDHTYIDRTISTVRQYRDADSDSISAIMREIEADVQHLARGCRSEGSHYEVERVQSITRRLGVLAERFFLIEAMSRWGERE